MKSRFTTTEWSTRSIPLVLALALSGCGSLNFWPFDGGRVWPFGGDKVEVRSERPPNATRYVCNGRKSFYVRMLDNGNAAWLIFPDREVRFDKAGATPGVRYSNGTSVLEINGNKTTLQDGPASSYTDCKAEDS